MGKSAATKKKKQLTPY